MDEYRLFCLGLIGIAALGGLRWGLQDTRRVIEYPFLYSLGLIVFILPQGYAVCNNPDRVPDEAFYISIAMILLCSVTSFLGYFKRPQESCKPPRYVYKIDCSKLFIFGLFISSVGTIGTIKLGDPSLVKVWRGWPVYWSTLAKLNLPGIIMMIVSCVISKNYRRLWIPILFSYAPFMNIIMRGRRSITIMLPVMYLVPFLITNRQLKIPKWMVVASIAITCIIVYAFPIWRDSFNERAHIQAIKDAPVLEIAEDMTSSDNKRILELVDGMLIMGSVWNRSAYQFGTVSIYNLFIQNYVPGGLVGRDFKKSLFIPVDANSEITRQAYGVSVASYTGKTVYADLFRDFGFFGAIILLWVARLYKRLHFLAINYQDGRAFLFLCTFAVLPAHMTEAGLWGTVVTSVPVLALLLFSFKHCMTRHHLGVQNHPQSTNTP